jgi:hypothetical protein
MLGTGSRESKLKSKKYLTEQIVMNPREAEVLLAKGLALGKVCRQLAQIRRAEHC